MSDITELVHRYVGVWNEADPQARRRTIASLWSKDGATLHNLPENSARGYEAIDQAHRVAAWSRDEATTKLIAAVLDYPGVPAEWREPDLAAPHDLVLPFELGLGGGRIAKMFGTETTLSTPQDVTLQELRIEAFYPADAETEAMSFESLG